MLSQQHINWIIDDIKGSVEGLLYKKSKCRIQKPKWTDEDRFDIIEGKKTREQIEQEYQQSNKDVADTLSEIAKLLCKYTSNLEYENREILAKEFISDVNNTGRFNEMSTDEVTDCFRWLSGNRPRYTKTSRQAQPCFRRG